MTITSKRGARPDCHGTKSAAATGADRASLYDEVTRRIIAELEEGRFPWVRPWGRTGGRGPGIPRNALTARPYSGVNILILWGAVIEQGWPSQSWLTFRQALEAGGNVRKGAHGVTVFYADRFTPQGEKQRGAEAGEREREMGSLRGSDPSAPRTVPFLKRFTVFNVAQCEGLREGLAADPAPLPEREIVPVAEAVIAASGVDFRIGGNEAFYAPAQDFVQVPPQPAFFEQINYYRTALHELTHATGHASRLDRKLMNGLGGKDYAREELVAEMGSAFLCAALGIAPTVRHADYLASWLDVLRGDSRAIFRAASQASKAADWLLARHACPEHSRAADASARRATTPKVPAMRSIVGMAEEGA
ncbi:DUF1738 domain-containing protein [Sphingomonas koreensis]|uniref:ArdC family protein n=1 Tax=Sphingomonas koreensis TaxID=93064 RepID=UPI0009FC82FF|nr:zincin-like metallopeptidase domain-containing protein [Sphingomonas koreensis]PJI87181.1 antirestriction protein ArdC [Sphingomonas koreensis]RSU59603.1 DUF1738 domain-containing protein [Sphingomonas koreensis]RSU68757.1 DUF1738 domain-containing protein [Sphingomonas koreensis]